MKFQNHICKKFLTDDNFIMEIVEDLNKEDFKKAIEGEEISEKIHSLYAVLCSKDQQSYYITETVLDKLDMLKLNKKGEHYDWTVFDGKIPNKRLTFIFPDNKLLRMIVQDDQIFFCHLKFEYTDKQKGEGVSNWVLFYLNRKTGELCEHFAHPDVKAIETLYYKFLCFMYLTDNDEVIIPPGRSLGTRKQGKVLNDLPVSLTIVNSRWNTTIIRTESFGVRGHFAIRRVGSGRTDSKLVFIEPFEKSGYIRRAGKELETT